MVDALRANGLSFGSFDILSDESVRQGLKEFSNWPTYPQLYVKGELLGGCDIVLQLQVSTAAIGRHATVITHIHVETHVYCSRAPSFCLVCAATQHLSHVCLCVCVTAGGSRT